MSAEPITAQTLRDAADKAGELDEILDKVLCDKRFPMLTGFDLDYLAEVFEDCANKIDPAGARG